MYAEQPAQRQRHHEIREKGYPYHRADALYAAQGVGEGVLHGVADLVGYERIHRDRHQGAHLEAVSEPQADDVAHQEDGHSQGQGYRQDEPQAASGGVAHGRPVLLPGEIADADGHGGGHAAVDHVEQLRHGDRHLVGGQGRSAEPSHEDGRQGERRRLHAHLQGDGETEAGKPPDFAPADAAGGVTRAEAAVAAITEEQQDARHGHDNARERRGQTRTEKPQLRRAKLAVDENPVAEDVEQVAGDDDEHGRLRVGDAVEELLERVEAAQERQRGDVHPQVRAHQGQQLFGLAEAVDVKAEHHAHGHEDGRKGHVGREAVLHRPAYAPRLAPPEQAAHNWREAVREARGEQDDEREHGVDEAGGGQLLHGMVADHERVGETQHYVAYLPHHDGQPEGHQRAVARPES